MLRYPDPASDWHGALPLGNGRLGAMVYGGVHTEKVCLNEESIWYGGKQDRVPVGAKEHLGRLRELIRAGKQKDAENLVKKHFLATPKSARHYEPLGTLNLTFDYGQERRHDQVPNAVVGDYERKLVLETAEVSVQYTVNGADVRREAIATHADNVIAIRIISTQDITFTASLTRMSDVDWEVNEFLDSITVIDKRIVLQATPGGKDSNSLCLVAGVRVEDGGTIEVVGRELQVTAKRALLLVAASTQYRHADAQAAAMADMDGAFGYTTDQLWKRHLDDWSIAYNRMSIQLNPDNTSLSTTERLSTNRDPGLIALYHAYSRYLLLSCSRPDPGALPATLQGIWNPSFQPPWGSKFVININLQMNYWAAHVSNLSECELSLFDLLELMAINGKRTATEVYGCRGWCAHHATDIFGDTEPQDRWMPASLWPLGGAWLCTHVWENYTFTGNLDLLVRMIPVLEGCILFLLDFLILDSSGKYLVTSPSLSPENTFDFGNGERGVFCEGSTIDMEIIRQVFQQYLHAASVLSDSVYSSTIVQDVHDALSRLQPITISPRTGTIQEWGLTDYQETELGHRHVSHLYALHPGNTITPSLTPELAKAAEKTLFRRLKHGGGHTGWSRAWLINFWARLRNPDQCAENIEALLRDSTLPNMLDTHPPFQIDGNFGGAAAIVECLVQSHEELTIKDGNYSIKLIRLLPSCPVKWRKGLVKGVKCRGGFELDFSWDEGTIKDPVVVRSLLGNEAMISFHCAGSDVEDTGVQIRIPASKGEHWISNPNAVLPGYA